VIRLRKSKQGDEDEVKACYEKSISIHQPWTYPPKNYKDYLAEEGRYFLCLDPTGEIVGTLSISGIVRGYFQSGYLGYEVFSPHDRKGYMFAGIKLLINEAFTTLNLHRLEASSLKIKALLGWCPLQVLQGKGFPKAT
jgi:ribosomal-protein-alanine N-acetyltransferase